LGLVDARELGGVHGLAEEGEDIKVHVLGLPQVVEMLNAGEIDNSPAIIAIQWLLLNKEEVDKAWGRSFEK
jgi:ADP-ribose pyrophosphatase